MLLYNKKTQTLKYAQGDCNYFTVTNSLVIIEMPDNFYLILEKTALKNNNVSKHHYILFKGLMKKG